MDEAAEVIGVAVFLLIRPRVTNVRGCIGFSLHFALEILLLPDDTPELLSLCLCLILTSPHFFL